LIALEVDFEKLLALDGLACLVLQFGDDLSGLDIDDVAGRGVLPRQQRRSYTNPKRERGIRCVSLAGASG
jgi:hypothetical protein